MNEIGKNRRETQMIGKTRENNKSNLHEHNLQRNTL